MWESVNLEGRDIDIFPDSVKSDMTENGFTSQDLRKYIFEPCDEKTLIKLHDLG
eukprot:CAMPEP_0182901308 /NCGR_PEP_ID=MMETSP0034_2-20130328/29549_1 /TAXON_ID=156128 /ORGANISM="Nephroselmis pyriformis, Strain CCMP717" /LENGTH=53 /DNA_ID=CAMNT_0025035697 /DNA_START=38 /DNA_END=195 /DNA_ORIENTATION=-